MNVTAGRASSLAVTLIALWAAGMVTTTIPYVYAWRHTPPEQVFTGLVDKFADGMTYLAKMRQGWEGHWLFENRYSYKDHPAVFLNVLFLALGHLARILLVSLPAMFQAMRLCFSLLMLAAVYAFYREWLPNKRSQCLALTLFVFASGLGWLPLGCVEEAGVRQESVDVWMPEAIPFYAMMVNPLFCVSMALLAYCAKVLMRISEGRATRYDALAVPAVVLLALAHPYDIILLETLVIGTLLSQWVARKLGRVSSLWIVLGLAPMPILAHQYHVFHTNPVMADWLKQNYTPSPHIVWYLTAYFGLLLCALFSLFSPAGRRTVLSVAGLWLLVGLHLAYAPVSFQRKLILGWAIPLAGFAGIGLSLMMTRWSAPFGWLGKTAIWGVAFAFLISGNAFLIVRTCHAITDQAGGIHPAYMWVTELRAMRVLSQNSKPHETVLASPRLGLLVPAFAGNRVLVGHWSESNDFYRLCGIANEFFSPNTTPDYRKDVIKRYGIRWVLSDNGVLENPDGVHLVLTWREGNTVLYRVRGPT